MLRFSLYNSHSLLLLLPAHWKENFETRLDINCRLSSFFSNQFLVCSFFQTPLAIFVSVSWFEPGQIEYTAISFCAAVLLPFAKALSFILLRNLMDLSGKGLQIFLSRMTNILLSGHINALMVEYTRLLTSLLFIPALFSYMKSSVEISASWESIDYVCQTVFWR